MTERPWLPYTVLLIGVAAVSWSAILIREATAPFLIIACYRLALASVPVGAMALIQSRRSPEPFVMNTFLLMLLSGALLAAHFAFWISSIQHTSIVTSVVLVATQPLYVALASPLLLREKVEPYVWVALLIATVGALTMVAEDLGVGLGSLAGDFYAALAGAFAAAYLIVGRSVRPTTSWTRYIGVVYTVSALCLFAAVLIAGDDLTGYSTKTYVMIGLLALGPQLIGHSSINFTLGYLSAVVVAMAILLEPIGTTILAAAILDERPTIAELAGGVLVLIGVYLAIRPRREERLLVEISSAD
jgi:drug/metabolite transporter (DMT)-like permease